MEFKKQDLRDTFELLCQKYFNFLLKEFGFKVISVKKDNYGCFITYRNNTTALKASLCPLEGRISLDFYRIINDQIPQYPVFFNPHTELLVFNFDTLIQLKTGKIVEQNEKDLYTLEGIDKILKKYAVFLKSHAIDLLNGNFDVLVQIKEVIAHRAKELEDEI